MSKRTFGELRVGARFRCDGEIFTKVEHDLREGMLQCSNAMSDDGRFTLLEPEQSVDVVAQPNAPE